MTDSPEQPWREALDEAAMEYAENLEIPPDKELEQMISELPASEEHKNKILKNFELIKMQLAGIYLAKTKGASDIEIGVLVEGLLDDLRAGL